MKSYNIFVYGTLRRGGMYADYLNSSELVRKKYQLPGFALYDYQHWYPFMVQQTGSTVVGDIYRVNEADLPRLHELEGVQERLFRFVHLEQHGFHTYLKYNDEVEELLYVEGGDWLKYLRSLPSKPNY